MNLKELLLDFMEVILQNDDYYDENNPNWDKEMINRYLTVRKINNLNIAGVVRCDYCKRKLAIKEIEVNSYATLKKTVCRKCLPKYIDEITNIIK